MTRVPVGHLQAEGDMWRVNGRLAVEDPQRRTSCFSLGGLRAQLAAALTLTNSHRVQTAVSLSLLGAEGAAGGLMADCRELRKWKNRLKRDAKFNCLNNRSFK